MYYIVSLYRHFSSLQTHTLSGLSVALRTADYSLCVSHLMTTTGELKGTSTQGQSEVEIVVDMVSLSDCELFLCHVMPFIAEIVCSCSAINIIVAVAWCLSVVGPYWMVGGWLDEE